MTQKVPYKTAPHKHLVTAMREWIIENDGVPHFIVPLTEVPAHLHRLGDPKRGIILLNVGLRAVGNYECNDEFTTFSCRFNGIATDLCIRTNQILTVYDRENQTVFMDMPKVTIVEPEAPTEPERKRPSLSVVK